MHYKVNRDLIQLERYIYHVKLRLVVRSHVMVSRGVPRQWKMIFFRGQAGNCMIPDTDLETEKSQSARRPQPQHKTSAAIQGSFPSTGQSHFPDEKAINFFQVGKFVEIRKKSILLLRTIKIISYFFFRQYCRGRRKRCRQKTCCHVGGGRQVESSGRDRSN